MVHALVGIFSVIFAGVKTFLAFLAGGASFTSLVTVFLGFGVVKLLAAFAISFVTYQITDGLIDTLISSVQSQLNNINFGDSQINAIVFDFIDVLGFDVGISIILSAYAFAFSLKSFGWVSKMGA